MRWFLIAIAIVASTTTAAAGGRGGHNTTFDPNFFPGATVTNFITAGATCNGVADDSSALTSFVSSATAGNPTRQVLYIPPGSRCTFTTFFTGSTSPSGTAGSTPIQNLVVWAYGATASNWSFGNFSFQQNYTHSARINSASAGATTVVVNDGNIARFSVGDWIAVTGLSMQVDSYPPNMNFFEYRLITAINSSTITLNTPLDNSYLSTWPLIDPGHTQVIDEGGPATIYVMDPSWNSNVTVYGLTVPASAPIVTGRNTVLYDVVSLSGTSGLNFSAGQNLAAFYSTIGPLVEIDKAVSNLTIARSSGGAFIIQSSSATNILFDGVTSTNSIGTSINTTIRNSVVPTVGVGAGFFGHSVNVLVDGTSIAAVQPGYVLLDKTLVTYSAGTFSILNSAGGPVWQWAVPNQKYFFGYSPGFSPGATCNAGVTFTVTAVRQDGTAGTDHTLVDTDLIGALPTPSCNGNVYNAYVNYGAASVTQRFSGPADLTQFAAPP